MIRVCPNPKPWHKAYQRLCEYAERRGCASPAPPTPLVLGGWVGSNDVDKNCRWEETERWAANNGCSSILAGIPDTDFYQAEKPSSYAIGPLGGPMYLDWNCEPKERPSDEALAQYLETLKTRWPEIVGSSFSGEIQPIRFTGRKARRLLVRANPKAAPPWGGWTHLSRKERKRRTFTRFREAINQAIHPHKVDHVGFTTD